MAAEILFGTRSLRIPVEKAWRMKAGIPMRQATAEERLEYIKKVKEELNLESFLRHSTRQMSAGTQRFQNYPVFHVNPRRAPIIANPGAIPLEVEDANGNELTPRVDNPMDFVTDEIKDYFKRKQLNIDLYYSHEGNQDKPKRRDKKTPINSNLK
ncbi:unnamed protein product [Blepharisma stoltei]|uniref:Uncharacterized protein n=1 Tax=Blepharisma stoltei TaxID=1481888 RepID=A0AAU9JF43_9CILI|nr:unnamed protein product [Blepharisma stoltei]